MVWLANRLRRRVGSKEQIAQGAAAQVGQAAPPAVLGPVVFEVAALAPGGQIRVAVAAGVVLAVAGGQDRHGQPGAGQIGDAAQDAAPAGAPGTGLRIPPRPAVEADDDLPVRPRAAFAASPGPAEADHGRELGPVDRVEVAVFGADRHGSVLARSRLPRTYRVR